MSSQSGSFLIVFLFLPFFTDAQSSLSLAELNGIKSDIINTRYSKLSLENIQETDVVYNPSLGGFHVYLTQAYKGIRVAKTDINVFYKNGKSTILGATIIEQPKSTFTSFPQESPAKGLSQALLHFDIRTTPEPGTKRQNGNKTYFKAQHNNSYESIVEKVWVEENGFLLPAWQSTFELPAPNNKSWEIISKVSDGSVVSEACLTVECNFEHKGEGPQPPHFVDDHYKKESAVNSVLTNTYRVFDLPIESPSFGNRTLTSSPWLRSGPGNDAATLGWHNDNVTNYSITRGNNVYAYEDKDNNNLPGFSPNGGGGLDFDFFYSPFKNPDSTRSAGLTNLFHTNNLTHDILYQYGFDEASGNFQNHNLGRGGLGADYVLAEGIDGAGTDNANFSTPPDGSRPRMQMFLWTTKLEFAITEPIQNQMNISAVESVFSTNNKLWNKDEVEGLVVLADDTLACNALVNAGAINGKIALIYRGSCNFSVKALNAQNAGALGIIVINNVAGSPTAMGGTDNSITIPAVMISNIDGALIRSLINQNVKIRMRQRSPDGNYDNGIIVHEYGHGVSNRLIGGPSAATCLQNEEQMGEGWSDYLALMLTTDWASASENTARGIGTYALNEAPEGLGIRDYKYSTDLNINPFTYDDIKSTPLTTTGRSPHYIGSIWATILWDLTWKLIESEGIDPDIYHGNGGNNIALQLVMDGMKLIKCSPGFVDGRDAILLADELRYNGIHKCAIWEAFARRGLGFSASQGSSNVYNDGTEAFDLPQEEIVSDMAVVEVDELTELVITKTIQNGCEVNNNFHFEDQIPEGTELIEVYSGIPLPGKKVGSPTQNLQVLQEQQISYKVRFSPCMSSGNALIETAEGASVFTSVNLLTGSRNWVKSSSHFNSPGMSWFAQNPNVTSDYTLAQSVNILLPETAMLSFRHKFDTEATWDGGVVEISVNNGPWSDLGEYAIENGYPSNFSSNGSSNLAGRPGFTGDGELFFGTSDFIRSSFDLSSFGGQNVKIRFRFASDDNTDGGSGLNGWYIDDISLDDASVIATTSFKSGIPNLQANTSFIQVIPFDQDIAFVDQGSNGNGNGKNWQDANNELETMLQLAGCRNVDSIYLAEGIYIPSESRDSSFVIPDGTSLIGGFQNGGLSRNFISFPSILSGEIGSTGPGDNVYHVVKNMATIHTNKLDGILIKNGNANGGGLESTGAGILNQGNLILQDVILENNTGGSALHNHNSGNIEFRGNTSVKQ